MLRVPLSKAWIKRTIRLNYGFTQTTPKSQMLDPLWDRSIAIWPGMCAMKTAGEKVTLINATGTPMGLFAEYIGGDGIDEPLLRGINATAVWVMGTDAELEVLAPAFDTGASWVDPGDGTALLVHAYVDGTRRGQLTPAGTTGRGTLTTRPVARLIKVDSASKIIVGGLYGTV
jgi:hypothetical protein